MLQAALNMLLLLVGVLVLSEVQREHSGLEKMLVKSQRNYLESELPK